MNVLLHLWVGRRCCECSWRMQEVDPSSDAAAISHLMMVRPFTRYVAYVEAQPVATQRRGAISNMLLFTTHMAGQPPSHDAIDNNRCKKRFFLFWLPLKLPGHGTRWLLNWFKRLADGSHLSPRTAERQYFCPNACPLPFNGEMRSPSSASSLPPINHPLQSFLA